MKNNPNCMHLEIVAKCKNSSQEKTSKGLDHNPASNHIDDNVTSLLKLVVIISTTSSKCDPSFFFVETRPSCRRFTPLRLRNIENTTQTETCIT